MSRRIPHIPPVFVSLHGTIYAAPVDQFARQLGGRGKLWTFNAKTGQELWQHHLVDDYQGNPTAFGFVSSPLLFGETVVVQAGGSSDNCILAFERKTGTQKWQSQSDTVDMASPSLARIQGVVQVIVVADSRVFALDFADGQLLWEYPCETDDWATALPLPTGELFLPMEQPFLLNCSRDERGHWMVRELWQNTDLEDHSSFYAWRDGFIYGNCADQIVCIDAKTGEIRWQSKSNDGSSALFDDTLVFFDRRTGLLRYGAVSNERFVESTFEPFPESTHLWTPPTFAAEKMFLRNSTELLCVSPIRSTEK